MRNQRQDVYQHRVCCKEDNVDRNNAEKPPSVKNTVIVGCRAGIEKNSANEKTRKNKEEIHTGPGEPRCRCKVTRDDTGLRV